MITLFSTPKNLKFSYIGISLIFSILFLFNPGLAGQPSETSYLGTTIREGSANDVSYGPFEIGFTFNFYGVSYTQFYVSSNGLVTFGNGSTSNAEATIPSATLPDNFIAPFWDDLKIDTYGSILYSTIGITNRKLVIQFRNMGFYPSPIYMGTFMVILYETDSKIQLQYRMIVLQDVPRAKGGDASIGIENAGGTSGVQYAFHNSSAVSSWKAISFTPSGDSYTMDGDAVYDGVYLTKNLTLPEPGITGLISPSNGSTVGTSVTFRWEPSENATTYRLRMANNPEMTAATTYYTGPDLTYTVPGLIDGTTYYWTVLVSNSTGFTWNEVKKFKVSSAPPLTAIPQTVWVEQSLDKTIKLDYTGGDANPKTTIVTSLPAQGQLFQYNAGVKGSEISSVPANVTDPGRNIIYTAPGSSGNGIGNFNFKVNDGSGDSPEVTITVNVSPPGIPSVLYIAKGSDIEIQFDRIMNDPTGRHNQFTATVNGSQATITSASLKTGDPNTIVLTLSPALTGTEIVSVSYTMGDIASSSGGFLLSFSDQSVTLLSQTINFTQSLDKKFNESPVTLSATPSSGLGMTYSSSNLAVATILSNIATLKTIGTSDITARQAGNSTYAPAKYIRTLSVSPGDQTISFNSLPGKISTDPDFNPGATASSGLLVSYTSSNTAVATIIGNLIHITGAGTTEITAYQPGDDYYAAAAPVSQTLSVSNPVSKILSLSSVFLQGLYNNNGTMRQVFDEFGPHWPAGVADHIKVELHNAGNYASIVYSAPDVPLSTDGTVTVNIPSEYTGSYYITIRHRNHIETTTANPVSFSADNIAQSFETQGNVFGGNLALSSDGRYMIYGGDVDQDGFVGASDMSNIDNLSASFGMGYLAEDVDGDSFVGASDMGIVDNNSANFIFSNIP